MAPSKKKGIEATNMQSSDIKLISLPKCEIKVSSPVERIRLIPCESNRPTNGLMSVSKELLIVAIE